MRPTGALHLGHYHGALKNWVRLQAEFECFYFVADWHALTTHYEERGIIEKNVYDMVIDWLAAGIDPDNATIFIQSRLPEHAELFTLLAMGTPLGWLERVPTYKDQMEKLKDRDLATYGFLGYPLLQAADILIYKAAYVPVGEDQSSHVELTREVARRFNHLYGREPNFDELARNVVKKLGKDAARRSRRRARPSRRKAARKRCRRRARCSRRARRSARRPRAARRLDPRHRQDDPARAAGAAHRGAEAARPRRHEDEQELRQRDRDARGAGRGREEDPRMPTDPARVRRENPGDPEKCPVWRCTRSTRPTRPRTGWSRAAPPPASAASTASSR
jgi:tryptophanyl-tRNA synthetase